MSFISNIPTALFNNIGLMAVLFMVYQLIKLYINRPSVLYPILVCFQTIGFTFFIMASTTNDKSISYFSIISLPHSLLPVISISYFLVLFFYLIRLIIQLQKVIQLKENANFESDFFWKKTLNESSVKLPENVKIAYSDKISSPVTLGFIEPIILLPFSIVNHLSTQEIKLILLHELAHIIKHDYLINILLEIIHCVLFFNPFSYFFRKEINFQRELAADEWVVNNTKDPLAYSKVLYQLANSTANNQTLRFSVPAINNSHELMERIKFMHNIKNNKKSLIPFVLSVSLFLFIFFNFSTTPKNKEIKPENIIVEKISAPKSTLAIHKKYILTSKKKVLQNTNNQITKEELTIQAPTYSSLVKETAKWIKEHENPAQYASMEESNDSLDYDIAEKLILQSIVKNYALKKEILMSKLEKVADEKEAYDYLMNSKEWEQIVQYDKWAKAFLKKHPGTFTPIDSLRSF